MIFTCECNFRYIKAQPLGVDNIYDIAILVLAPNPFETPPRPNIQIGDTNLLPLFQPCCTSLDRPRDGDSIAVSGYPLNSPTMITTAGNLASGWCSQDVMLTDKAGKSQKERINIYLADISVNPGNSGAPAYRMEDSCVIGVCTAHQTAPLFFTDSQNGHALIADRQIGVNAGLHLV